MDIQYLLFLQEIREATGGVFDEFFNALSKFAVDILPFLPYVIFWCVSKKWGYRFIATITGGELVNGIVKLTVCAYRPWIRSNLIEPAGDSKVAATGYSFPSGHTMCATTMYGTVFAWQRKERKALAITCCVLIFLTAFSRNFLGVHTPQDVLVGFAESALLAFLSCIGLGLVMAWKQIFAGATVTLMFGENWGKFVTGLILSVFAIVAWPAVITKYCTKSDTDIKQDNADKKQDKQSLKKQKKVNAG